MVVLATVVLMVAGGLAVLVPRFFGWSQTTVESWEPGSDGGTSLVVTVMGDGNPGHVRAMVIDQTATTVRLRASVKATSGTGNAMGHPTQVTVTLKAPLGERQVIDDVTGAVVPGKAP